MSTANQTFQPYAYVCTGVYILNHHIHKLKKIDNFLHQEDSMSVWYIWYTLSNGHSQDKNTNCKTSIFDAIFHHSNYENNSIIRVVRASR